MNVDEYRHQCQREALSAIAATTVFRGQWCGEDGLRTEHPTFAFGSRRTAELYASNPNNRDLAGTSVLYPRVWEARLAVSCPYVLILQDDADPFFDLHVIAEEFGREVLEAIVRVCSNDVMDTGSYEEIRSTTGMDLDEMLRAWPDQLDHLPAIPGFRALQVPEFVEALEWAGYDSVCLGGYGENALELEWHIFDADLAIDVTSGAAIGRSTLEVAQELSPH